VSKDAADSAATLAQQVESRIRESILQGQFKPGDRLRERDLSVDLGVSRLPVREALHKLEHAGFVVSTAHKGASVRKMTALDISELFDLRLQLEPLAASEAAKQYRAGNHCAELEIAIDETVSAAESGSKDQVLITTASFHDAVLTASRHGLMSDLMSPILARTRWVMAMTLFRDPVNEALEHRAIFDAIADGNCELAKLRMAAHVEAGRVPSIKALSNLNTADPQTEDKEANGEAL